MIECEAADLIRSNIIFWSDSQEYDFVFDDQVDFIKDTMLGGDDFEEDVRAPRIGSAFGRNIHRYDLHSRCSLALAPSCRRRSAPF